MNLFKNLLGTIATSFKIGIAGPILKTLGLAELSLRNSDDSGFAALKVGTPTNGQHAVTKDYADSLEGIIIISRQADCTSALPANTGTAGYVVVTTAGTGAAVGDLLKDDGSSTGNMAIITARNGRTISLTVALTGGTATFGANSLYTWDAEGTAWALAGDVGGLTGSVRVVRYAITNSATQDSASTIPANARILAARVEITTPYSGGATLAIGRSGSTSLLQATTDNDPTAANTYEVDQDTGWGGSALAVRTTIGGSPAAGAGTVTVLFTVPNA